MYSTTQKKDKVNYYIDGVFQDSKPQAIDLPKDSAADVLIGDGNTAGPEHFNGAMDEVAIFSAALTEDDINEVMKGFKIVLAVSPSEKLTTTWGRIKNYYE